MQARIQGYLRAVAPIGRQVEQVGPFLATFSPDDENPYLNYAIPDDGADPSLAEVEALIAAYARGGRRARLEYVSELAPEVEASLLAAGLQAEGRLALMVIDHDRDADVELPPHIEMAEPATDDDLHAMATVQAEAYGDRRPDRSIVAIRRAALDRGAIFLIARDPEAGVVGAGSCSPVHGGLAEVAAIGVASSHRRRGIATALAHSLAKRAIARGADLPWLMAATDSERRSYQRAGFTVTGEMLHISLPV